MESDAVGEQQEDADGALSPNPARIGEKVPAARREGSAGPKRI